MATTNSTTNYGLSQYVGSDVTSYLTNYNGDMTKIDAQMKRNADSAATANDNATIAVSTATTAASDASTALSTANTASSTAASAQTTAQEAQTAAGAAQTDAAAALRASAANTIENLAPAYDPTLTYNVGDLVTYVDENNSGKLYKCIVAIATPEAFNVNKWDDVTASEAFAPHNKILGTFTTDGIKTWSDMILWFKDILLLNPIANINAHMYRIENNGIVGLYRVSEINDVCVGMSNINTTGTYTNSGSYINMISAKKHTDNTWHTIIADFYFAGNTADSSTVTRSENIVDSSTPLTSGITYYLVN